jgi:HlyD family secretion protein
MASRARIIRGRRGVSANPAASARPDSHASPDELEPATLSLMDRRLEPRSRWPRRLVFMVIGLGVVAVAAAAYVRFGLSRTLVVSENRIVVASVKADIFDEYIPATARVAPRTTAYLDAVEGGQVAEVLVEDGASVRQGQPLVRLKNTNLQLEVLGRQAQLMEQLDRLNATILSFEQARLAHDRDLIETGSQIEQLTQRLRRRQALRPSGSVSAADVDEIAIDLARYQRQEASIREAAAVDRKFQGEQITQLRAAVKTIQGNLNMAGETLDSLTVRAPITGQLTGLDAYLGEAKSAGQRIGQVDQLDDYKVEADIDEFYLPRVAVGQSATVEIDGREQRLELAKVYPQVRDRQFKVDLLFAPAVGHAVGPGADEGAGQSAGNGVGRGAPKSLRRGQSLQIRLQIGASRRTLVVANGPFYDDTGGTWAFVLSPSGTEARRRAIRLGRRNPQQIEVLSGLSAGDQLITSSYESLRGFERIRVAGHID